MSDRSKGNKKEINSHIALFFDIETSHIEFDDTQKEENRKVFENYIKGINDNKIKHELDIAIKRLEDGIVTGPSVTVTGGILMISPVLNL